MNRLRKLIFIIPIVVVIIACSAVSPTPTATQSLILSIATTSPSLITLPTEEKPEDLKSIIAPADSPKPIKTTLENTKPGLYILAKAAINGEPYLYFISVSGEIIQKINMEADWGTSNYGTQLLVMSYSSGQLKNFDSLNKEWTNIDIDIECYEGNWSPDRKYIVFSCGNGGPMEIYLYDTYSKSITEITDCQKHDMLCINPSWSLDGQWLAYWKVEARSGTDLLHEI